MNLMYYHGSVSADIRVLEPRSLLHGTKDKVLYLTNHIPYALLYIWDGKRHDHAGKYVTAWIKDGVAYYEEQFPDQLRTFYQGVKGCLYGLPDEKAVLPVPQRESLYYARQPLEVSQAVTIVDVYEELMKYEAMGLFKVLYYREQTAKRQEELIDLISEAIKRSNFFQGDQEEIRFMKKHFAPAWQRAQGK